MKNYNDILPFMDSFSTESQCLEHLTELKWGAGYSCRKCTHTVCVKGRTWHHKRCQKCGYDESCTAHTLFHKLKFPIVKSFMICHQLSTMKKGMSSSEISRQYSIHQETAWCFKRKVQLAMRSCGQVLLKSKVEVDETVIGGYEHGAVGRSKGKKTPVQLVVEVEHDEAHPRRMKIKNARAWS